LRTLTALVVDDEPANRLFINKVLASSGWRVIEATNGEEAIVAARQAAPDLVVMDIDMPVRDGWSATDAIRAGDTPLSSVPILAFTTLKLTDGDLLRRGMDGRVPKPCTPEQLIAATARWRPDGEMSGAKKLADVFGREELAGLVERFRDQLADAIDAIDDGNVSMAHRIAGVAGTLGFAAVSASWLALSEGDDSVRDQARRDARIAIVAIDRDRENPALD
jgi:CheY-like chemotaxis protein